MTAWTATDETTGAFCMVRNRPDPVKLKRAKELRREVTTEEQVLWHFLRRSQLDGFHFYRQKVLAGFIVDFCCPKSHIIVEVDGGIHEQQVEYDAERDTIVQAHGWRVLRIANDDVRRDTAAVLACIHAACHETQRPAPEHKHAQNDATVLPFPPQREGAGG